MTPQETVLLTAYVKACCPQQALGEYTPDAWHDLLGDLALADCREAVGQVARRQPFVAPAEIRAEVKRIRNERIASAIIPAPPPELADDPRAYQRALQANIRRAADGDALPVVPERPALPAPDRRDGQPASLRDTIAGFRRALGPALRRRGPRDPQALAAEQAAEARTEAEKNQITEEAS